MERKWQTEFSRIFYPTAGGHTPFRATPYEIGCSTSFSVTGLEIGDLIRRNHRGDLDYFGLNVTKSKGDPKIAQKMDGFEPVHLEPGVDYTVEKNRFPGPSIFGATNDARKPFTTASIDRYVNSTILTAF